MLLRLLPFIGILLLALPVLELASSIWLAGQIGWWLLAWLLASALLGISILKSWRLATAWAVLDSVRSGEVPLGRLFWVARTLVAALLFIFPGPVSDVLGLILMLPWPGVGKLKINPATHQPEASDVYEGEFQRVDETAPGLPRRPGE